jgi:peptide/nickel transport system substrate-binding protein
VAWRGPSVALFIVPLLAAVTAAACRSGDRKTGEDDAAKAAAAREKAEKMSAFPHPATTAPLEMATLPEPGSAAAARDAQSHGGPRTGGTLRIHLDSEPPHLNPLADADASIAQVVSGLIYESLIECTPDGYEPALADRWTISSDGLRIVLHVRQGVRWHDHHIFSGVDVQASLERVMRSSSSLPLTRADLSDVAEVEIASDHVVRLNLRQPSDMVLRALCDVPILPDHLMKPGTPESVALAKQPVGTGPFHFLGWDRG